MMLRSLCPLYFLSLQISIIRNSEFSYYVLRVCFVQLSDSIASYRYEATDMNVYRSALSACVIMGLPNVNDYIHKHRERLMEEKRQKLLALEVHRSQHQPQQDQIQQNSDNSFNNEIPTPPPMPQNTSSSNENRQN